MKVSKLIKSLQNFPQNLDVYFACNDNYEWEVAGNCNMVILVDKNKCVPFDKGDDNRFESMPNKYIVIRD